MINVDIYPMTLTAGGVYRLQVSGTFFKILSCTGAVEIKGKFGKLSGITTGQGLSDTPFDDLFITDKSGGANVVQLIVGDQNFIDGATGSVAIVTNKVPVSGAFLASSKTVTNASAQLLAANTSRQYLAIQNNDASGDLRIQFGAAATLAAGLKIPAGATWELQGVACTQAIFAIGTIANNANVNTVEG